MAKSIFLAVCALCSFVSASCQSVKFEDCGSAMSSVKEVDIIPCPTQPCELKRGSNETVEVKFIPNEIIEKAITVVYGVIGGEPLPFPVDNPNACEGQGITCPMKPGQEYMFKTVLEVKSIYPAIQLIVKWEMKDQTDKMVFCFELPVKLV